MNIVFLYYQIEYSNIEIIFIGSFSIIGHIFPIWLKFKGGKGVSTYIGFVLGIDYKLGVIFIICWLIIGFIKRYASLASVSSLIILLIITIFLSYKLNTICILFILSVLITIKHTSNIKRLINGSENKIKF